MGTDMSMKRGEEKRVETRKGKPVSKNYSLDSDMKNGKEVEMQTRTWTRQRRGNRKSCRALPGLRNKEGEAS
jgi:hypothetical protein